MSKYEVTLYYHTSVTVEVIADNEKDAITNAYIEAGDKKYDEQFLYNLEVDSSPDVCDITKDY